MTPVDYLASQSEDRVALLTSIHNIIIDTDKSVTAEVGLMMGKEMILYKDRGAFKYALASGKEHMSLHMMPMYCSTVIYDKFSKLLNKAKFQKGCVNFKTAEAMPLPVVQEFINDCAPIDIADMLEKLRAARK